MPSFLHRRDRTGGPLWMLYFVLGMLALPPVSGLAVLLYLGTVPGWYVVQIWLATMIMLPMLCLYLASGFIMEANARARSGRQTPGRSDES